MGLDHTNNFQSYTLRNKDDARRDCRHRGGRRARRGSPARRRPKGRQEGQEGQESQEGRQEGPKGRQEEPKGCQEGPKGSQGRQESQEGQEADQATATTCSTCRQQARPRWQDHRSVRHGCYEVRQAKPNRWSDPKGSRQGWLQGWHLCAQQGSCPYRPTIAQGQGSPRSSTKPKGTIHEAQGQESQEGQQEVSGRHLPTLNNSLQE